MPDINKQFILRTDASNLGVGAVLMQQFEKELWPIAYASKKLTPAQRNYSTTEKEGYAIIWALQKFYTYLYGVEFILQVDHQSLAHFHNVKSGNGRILRWMIYLQSFKFKVNYIKGVHNVGADYLSRMN